MSNTQVTTWTKTSSPAGKYLMVIDENNEPFLLEAAGLVSDSGYQGKAFIATDPGTLGSGERGYWYFAGEAGVFTNFDGLTAAINDQLWWNGSTWDLIPAPANSDAPKFEAIATQDQTVFNLGTQLTADDLVQVNGTTIQAHEFSGVGTTTLTLIVGLDEGDFLIVKHS